MCCRLELVPSPVYFRGNIGKHNSCTARMLCLRRLSRILIFRYIWHKMQGKYSDRHWAPLIRVAQSLRKAQLPRSPLARNTTRFMNYNRLHPPIARSSSHTSRKRNQFHSKQSVFRVSHVLFSGAKAKSLAELSSLYPCSVYCTKYQIIIREICVESSSIMFRIMREVVPILLGR